MYVTHTHTHTHTHKHTHTHTHSLTLTHTHTWHAQVLELHQRLYSSEVLLTEKHQEVVLCYQRMAGTHSEKFSLQWLHIVKLLRH